MAIKNSSKIILFIIITGLILIYGYFQVRNLLLGPEIEIISPQYIETTEETIEIRGIAKRIQALYLNGGDILTTEDGTFGELLILHPGYNIIELQGKDKFDREITKTLEITKN